MCLTLLLDIEGTITDSRGGESNRTGALQQKLKTIESSGTVLIFCSGRDLRYIQDFKHAWGLSTDSPVIAENGCVIFDGVDKITPFDTTKYPHDLLLERLLDANLLAYGEVDPAKEQVITLYPKGFSYGLPYTQKQILDILEFTEGELTGQNVNITYSSASVDIMPKGVDKLFGLIELQRRLPSVTLPRCMYIGDSRNDLEVGKHVQANGGLFCVPQNALDDLKHVADHVADHEFGEGVLEIIERYDIE